MVLSSDPLRVGSGKTQWCRVFPLDGIRLHGMSSYLVHSPVSILKELSSLNSSTGSRLCKGYI